MNDTSNAKTLPFEFHGKAGEFFGIWIVNILLTIVTLGFYTPWAKVRTRRYFYGNTQLDNSAFDYTADPWAIFKGYMIAVVVFIVFSGVSAIFPPAQLIFMLLLIVIMPWLVVRSMMFTARNSVFRNIRFSFQKSYKEAAIVFIGIMLLVPLTLGLIVPYMIFRQNKFLVDNSGFGTSGFKFHATPGDFYMVYLKMIGVFLIPIALIGILAAIAVPAYQDYMMQAQMSQFVKGAGEPGDLGGSQAGMMMALMVGYIVMIIVYVGMFAYMQARIGNLIWNNIEFVTNRFESTLRARDLLWLMISNTLAIVFSFGLMVPWAKVRMAKYKASKLSMLAVTDLNGFIKYEQEQVGALGDEIGEMFDVEIGL